MPVPTADRIAALIGGGLVLACTPFMAEAGYSAQNAVEYEQLMREFSAMPRVAIDFAVEERAMAAQAELARAGHHRVPPTDLLIAAIADREGIGVLHYDKDYDIISEKTGLAFESVWLAERGSL